MRQLARTMERMINRKDEVLARVPAFLDALGWVEVPWGSEQQVQANLDAIDRKMDLLPFCLTKLPATNQVGDWMPALNAGSVSVGQPIRPSESATYDLR